MFYFLLTPLLIYNRILIFAAVIPAIVLMVYVYKSDRLEKESSTLLWTLVKAGILSSLLALVEEYIGEIVLSSIVNTDSKLYDILLYFGIVAFAEESSKYIFLKKNSWNNREFNCQYDGVVYAVFVSLGFALWENISYVMRWGFSTALVRSVTAIPGHACFGVFMGIFYGLSRSYTFLRRYKTAKLFKILSVVVPGLLHGSYDYLATLQSKDGNVFFIIFIIVLFIISFVLIRQMSRNDKYFKMDRYNYDFEILN